MQEKPLLLITNDDGIDAAGIFHLAKALLPLGEIWIVAPQEEQSGVSQAITVHDPIRLFERDFPIGEETVKAFALTGTPADCVKFAIHELLPRPPAIVVSGINHGPNAAVNVLYSGTVGGAFEATVCGYPAVAISLNNWNPNADFSPAGEAAYHIIKECLKKPFPEDILLNVNVPAVPYSEIQGYQVTRQARSRWDETFSLREDPFRRPYYWLAGFFVNLDEGPDTDLEALHNNYVSITPTKIDLTAYSLLEELRTWNWKEN